MPHPRHAALAWKGKRTPARESSSRHAALAKAERVFICSTLFGAPGGPRYTVLIDSEYYTVNRHLLIALKHGAPHSNWSFSQTRSTRMEGSTRGVKYNLTQYSADNVIGGPGAFVIAPDRTSDYAAALRRKLVSEISLSAKSASREMIATNSVIFPYASDAAQPPPTRTSWRASSTAAAAHRPSGRQRAKRRRPLSGSKSSNDDPTHVMWIVWEEWCCQRGLNSRPLPYQGSALPLSYCSIYGRTRWPFVR